jgi:hypothetical protein
MSGAAKLPTASVAGGRKKAQNFLFLNGPKNEQRQEAQLRCGVRRMKIPPQGEN